MPRISKKKIDCYSTYCVIILHIWVRFYTDEPVLIFAISIDTSRVSYRIKFDYGRNNVNRKKKINEKNYCTHLYTRSLQIKAIYARVMQ